MILLSHPTAENDARHAALALSHAGVLGEFWTCSLQGSVPHPCRVIPPAWPAVSATGAARAAFDAACRSLDHMVSSRLACDDFKGVYAHEGCADESFRIAGLRGMLRIYHVATGHWPAERSLCAEEAALEPEWAATLPPPLDASMAARRDSELQQADLVMVPSTFVLQTFEQVPALAAAIAVLPPGAPARHDDMRRTSEPSHSLTGKLRVLYVGELTQRQGISYLFDACRELSAISSLTVIGGRPAASCPALENALGEARWLDACSADELQAELAAHDVLLAPSLFDAFDPVLLDAMAAGLPLIATPHTAAPDLIDHGVEGFIVPIRSSEEIAAKLELLWREPERRALMSRNACRRAWSHRWENYERALAASVATALSRR